jgi:predicted  nucleic acid-binding Zn-ribbon protein
MISPYKEYYMSYDKYLTEIKDLDKTLRQEINSFKQKINESVSTLELQNKIQDLLKKYKELYTNLDTAYTKKNIPGGMPDGTITKRQNDIQQLGINYNDLEKEFKSITDEKYRFKNLINEDYSKKEEYKNMSTGEIMVLEKKKLQSQDERLEEITLDVKKGTQQAANVGHVIKDQNKQLDQMNEDIDRTKERMDNLTVRFEKYVAKYSMCKMIIILIIELAIAVVCGFLLF